MNPDHQITEAEIIDVVLGDADPELKARVYRAMKQDPELVALYNEWEKELKPIQDGAAEIRKMSERVERGVMNKIHDVEFDPEVFHDSSEIGLSEDRARWFHKTPIILIAVACLFFVVIGVAQFFKPGLISNGIASTAAPVRIVDMSGNVVMVSNVPGANKYIPLAAGEKLLFPSTIEVRDQASVKLVFNDGSVIHTKHPAVIRLESQRLVMQNSGRVTYLVETASESNNFTVQIPQGNVVDLGTEFEINVHNQDIAIIDVMQGRVLASPAQGQRLEVVAGQKAHMNAGQAVIQPINDPDGVVVPDPQGGVGENVSFNFPSQFSVFGSSGALTQFVQPKNIPLRPSNQLSGNRKLPPFTSSNPMMGILRIQNSRGKMIEAALAVDKKLDDKWRIYFDVNLNNDLTDDPAFVEGVDFKPGTPFAAGALEDFGAAWLEMPVETVRSQTSIETVIPGDRLNFYNMNYIHAQLDVPPDNKAGEEDSFVIFDHDSDGDFGDSDGAYVAWTHKPNKSENYRLMAMAPIVEPLYYLGYQWKLSRQLSGEGYRLDGEAIGSLKPAPRAGNVIPALSSVSTTGDLVDITAPSEGMLLIYAWSTWHSACRNDVSSIVRDIYPKYRERGLSMVGVSVDHNKTELLEYLRQNNISYPQIYNGPNQYEGIAGNLGIRNVPTAILVDSRNAIVSVDSDLESLINHLEENLPTQ